MGLTFGSLFAGIGGIDLGFERAGLKCKWQVEIDDYARRVLAKHWPDVPRFTDIREFPPRPIDPGLRVDVIAGGFPCQDTSCAGKGAGLAGERSGLFFELCRVVREMGPRYVVLENTRGLFSRGFGVVIKTLAELGYSSQWALLRASRFGAGHRRERVFIVSNAARNRLEGRMLPAIPQQLPRVGDEGYRFTVTEPIGIGTDHGISHFVDRIRGLGNAVVPQVAQYVAEMVLSMEDKDGR